MTEDQAKKTAALLATVDGDCEYCARDLARGMRDIFPEFDWLKLVGDAGEWDFSKG